MAKRGKFEKVKKKEKWRFQNHEKMTKMVLLCFFHKN